MMWHFMNSKLLQWSPQWCYFLRKNYQKTISAEFSHFLVPKKSFFCHQKVTKFCGKFLLGFVFCKKWHHRGVICKSFEVMKSHIIILSIECNTHLHTLIKKQCYQYQRKQREDRSSGDKTHFWGQTKIYGQWGG